MGRSYIGSPISTWIAEHSRAAAAVAIVALSLGLAACGGGDDDGSDSTSTSADAGEPVVDDSFPVGDDGHKLAIRCYGEGSPAIVFDSGFGSSAIGDYYDPDFQAALAGESTVCFYDRAGEGLSDSLPKECRTIEDLSADLNELLGAAEVPPPYVMVGASFGGFVSVDYAVEYPDEVSGLVLLDVPHPNPKAAAKDEGIQCDAPDNRTRIDSVEAEAKLAKLPPINEMTVTVMSGSKSENTPKSQEFWLGLSPGAEQQIVDTTHEIYAEDPEAVQQAVLDNVAAGQ